LSGAGAEKLKKGRLRQHWLKVVLRFYLELEPELVSCSGADPYGDCVCITAGVHAESLAVSPFFYVLPPPRLYKNRH